MALQFLAAWQALALPKFLPQIRIQRNLCRLHPFCSMVRWSVEVCGARVMQEALKGVCTKPNLKRVGECTPFMGTT